MEYELSQHAKDVIAEREITHEWVDRVLENPAKVEPDPIDDELEHRRRDSLFFCAHMEEFWD